MPRSSNYYEETLNRASLPEPIEAQASNTLVAPKLDQSITAQQSIKSAGLPAATSTSLSDIRSAKQAEETRKEALGITQKQLDENVKKAVDKARYEWALSEANRPLADSLPYELANTIFDMPDQSEWETSMTTWDKIKHFGIEVPKFAWNVIKAFPRELIKAPLRLSHGILDLQTRALDKLTGYKPGTNEALDALRFKPSYNLPVLGEIKGVGGLYDEGIEMGLSPFAAAVKATGEFSGDLAMSASLTEAVGAAFKPRVVTVQKGVTGPDFRPLQAEQIEQIKVKPGAKKLSTGEVVLGEFHQNPNVSYFRLPKSAASKYGGNSDNTFLKLVPAGEGQAKISVVQVRKSLFNQAKDVLTSKFGKSKVVQGPLGPELNLESGLVKYNPSVLTRTTPGKTAAPSIESISKTADLETVLGNIGKKQKNISTAEAYQFYSPNIEENLTFDDAFSRLESGNQILYKKIGEDIDSQLGHQSQSFNAIGDWSDGAENTVFNTIQKVNSFDELKYSTAIKGKIGKQKAVIPFMVQQGGADSLFMADIKNVNIKDIRAKLDELGISQRTLVPDKNGAKVVIFDKGSQLSEQMAKFEQTFNVPIDIRKGVGEFLGSDASREEGMAVYDEIIKNWESNPTNKIYNKDLAISGKANKTDSFIDPYTKARLNRKNPITAVSKGQPNELPSVMAKPLKGFENSLVSEKQTDQILGITAEKELSDVGLQAVIKTITGKDNLFELTQTEAFDVAETVRLFTGIDNLPESDSSIILRSFTHPARYWMEPAEREFGYPIYSEGFLRLETATRAVKIFKDGSMQKYREIFDNYSNPKFSEERRLIYYYAEGDKNAILNNKYLSDEEKIKLSEIGDYTRARFNEFFSMPGMTITSKKWFDVYMPKIRKAGGISALYKTGDVPAEIKPFFEFEREGAFSPIEDDALAVLDIYTSAMAKKLFLAEPVRDSIKLMEKLPENIKAAFNDYIQEKLGYQDKTSEYFNNISKKLSKATRGFLPEDIIKQVIDFGMTTSYAGALGLPRIMPILRNSVQPLLTTYPDLGPKYFAEGVKRYIKNGSQKIRDKGFLVEMGVPYGADLVSESSKSFVGKSLDFYKNFNKLMMKLYAGTDNFSRGITYYGLEARFDDAWNLFNEGKIDYNQFERDIDMAGFNPTLRKVLEQKFVTNTDKSLDEAKDLMAMDILDRTQFPYRKGSESRLHYGLKGKLGLQFAQWPWEYAFTLKSWVARGQWEKVVRWLGMSTAVKKSIEENSNADVKDWMGWGPFNGFPVGPIGKAAASAVAGINASFVGMDDEVNKNWKDVANALKIYGGVLTGVGVQRIKNFWNSIERYEAGVAVSTDPDPEKKFGIWSTNGKLIRWVNFSELLQTLMGFNSKSGLQQSDRISIVQKKNVEYNNKLNKAMSYLVEGKYDKFDKIITDNNIMIPDITTKMKSYTIPLDERIFEKLPMDLKSKYFNAFYPMEQ